jgi:hypothetical protein
MTAWTFGPGDDDEDDEDDERDRGGGGGNIDPDDEEGGYDDDDDDDDEEEPMQLAGRASARGEARPKPRQRGREALAVDRGDSGEVSFGVGER